MAWTCDIDGTDITSICQSIRWHSKHSRMATGIVRYPAHLFTCEPGTSEMHIYDGATLKFSGPVWYIQSEGSPDYAYTEVTAYDHLIWLNKRLCKAESLVDPENGNLITPQSVINSEQTGPKILAKFINNSILVDDDNTMWPPMPLIVDLVDDGGEDLSAVPQDWPMTIEQMRSLLCSTGQLNVILVPGVGSSTVNLTNGGIVNDLSGSVAINWQTGTFNAQMATVTEDMEELINALWYLLGPRGPRPPGRETIAFKTGKARWIPKDHFAGSITPTAPNAAGGVWPPALLAAIEDSRQTYGYMQEVRIFDDASDEQSIRPLFETEWSNEALLRASPRQFVSIKPERGTPLNFAVGDKISVAAGPRLHGGIAGGQIVFEIEVEIDPDGVLEITDIVATPDLG